MRANPLSGFYSIVYEWNALKSTNKLTLMIEFAMVLMELATTLRLVMKKRALLFGAICVAMTSSYAQGEASRHINDLSEDELVYWEEYKRGESGYNFIYQAIKYKLNFAMVKVNDVTLNGIHATFRCTVVENVQGDCRVGDTMILHRVFETSPEIAVRLEGSYIYLIFDKKDHVNYKKTNTEWEIISYLSYDIDFGKRALARVKKDFPQFFMNN